MESSSATTPTPEEQKARKAAELRGAPFLVYRDDKGHQKLVELHDLLRGLVVAVDEEGGAAQLRGLARLLLRGGRSRGRR